MAKIKVFQGTRTVDAPRLCDSCSSGVVMRGAADSEEYVYCTMLKNSIAIRVTECNRFEDRAEAPLWAMKEVAWVLDIDSRRQKIGFQTAKEWKGQHEGEDPVPGFIE